MEIQRACFHCGKDWHGLSNCRNTPAVWVQRQSGGSRLEGAGPHVAGKVQQRGDGVVVSTVPAARAVRAVCVPPGGGLQSSPMGGGAAQARRVWLTWRAKLGGRTHGRRTREGRRGSADCGQ
jgi:hypothetical protein